MLTSARRALSYPNTNRSDTADVPRDIATIIAALELDVVFGQGTHAARPAAGAGAPAGSGGGRLYWETDTAGLFYDTGAAWIGPLNTQVLGAGSVTTAMLASTVPIVPIGGVIEWPWPVANAPAWTVLPVGQVYTQAAQAALYAAVGATGGTVTVPDYRGRVAAGADDMGGVAAGRVTLGISGTAGGVGAIAGSEGVVLTTAQIPAHNHGITDPQHSHSITSIDVPIHTPSSGSAGSPSGDRALTNLTGTSPSATGITINNAGGGGAHSSMQPTLFVNKIMRLA